MTFHRFDASQCGWAVSEWFAQYSEDAECQVGVDGYPIPLPVVIGEALRNALADFNPSGDQIEKAAAQIYTAAAFGRIEEAPRSRPAAPEKTEQQLQKVHDLCRKLAAHIKEMNQPAVAALFLHNCDISALGDAVRNAQEAAKAAFDDYERGPALHGAPTKMEAREVTLTAALHFHSITGKPPGYTTDPASGKMTGLWPSVLSAVFKAMMLNANVVLQVRWLQKEMPPENWTLSHKTPLILDH